MTNTIAIVLGVLIILALILDTIFFGTQHLVFLGKKMLELLNWIAIWR